MSAPRISAIICTCGRKELLARALASVRAQDIDEPYEIVVVDTATEPVEVDDVRVIRLGPACPGTARAAGLEAARGELIAWCDDDDEWDADHLRTLRECLDAHPDVDLVYADSRWPDESPRGFSVPYSVGHDGSLLKDSPYIFATDVMHRASAARAAGGFDRELTAFEDWDLWLRMSLCGLLRHLDRTIATHHWHDGCVSARDNWESREFVRQRHARRLEALGPAAQHDLRVESIAQVPFDPATWTPPRRELLCHAILRPNQGYGSAARSLVSALEQARIDIVMAPTRNQPAAGFERFYKHDVDWGRIAFYYDYLDRPSALPSQRIVHYTMAESTRVPPDEVAEINRAVSLLYVPCTQNAGVFRECGVRVPIRVLPHGIDPKAFPILDRQVDRVCTFGTFGELSPRKGIDVLVRAFQDEFAPGEAVQLLMKTSAAPQSWGVRDARIRVIAGFMDHVKLLELLRDMDAFVMPSRGEGFGLCGLEAMASGLPLIATNWSGPADYLDPADSYPLEYTLVDAGGTEAHGMNFFGQWAEPSYDHLRSLLRRIFENRDEARQRGLAAADRVHLDWTWQRAALRLRDNLDEFAPTWTRARAEAVTQ